MKNIVLTGMMGSGKTTCGKALARRLGREFLDTDAMIVSQAGKSIPEIFSQEGEPAFRDWETAICRHLTDRGNLIIATGGGLILRPENVALLKARGVLVFLNRPADLIFDSTSMAGRPLAQNGKAAFLQTFAVREPYYRAAADAVIETFPSVEDTVTEILQQLHTLEGVL